MSTLTLNKKDRRTEQLNAHYARCEALGRFLGLADANGKKISLALLKAERDAHKAAVDYCNGDIDNTKWQALQFVAEERVRQALGTVPPGFFVNGDARGYALKIDNENAEGKAIIDRYQLHRDWGGYGILSPKITGD